MNRSARRGRQAALVKSGRAQPRRPVLPACAHGEDAKAQPGQHEGDHEQPDGRRGRGQDDDTRRGGDEKHLLVDLPEDPGQNTDRRRRAEAARLTSQRAGVALSRAGPWNGNHFVTIDLAFT